MQIDIVYLGKQIPYSWVYRYRLDIEYRRIKYVGDITTQYQYETA